MASLIPVQNYDPKNLPPGFRFHPTDEELVISYLVEKVVNPSFRVHAITEVDLNKCEPWDLPEKAEMGEKEWYFFSLRDRKYPTGMRTNRATEAGYWKATGKDRDVMKAKGGLLVGMKKTLVFYKGRAPRGEKTNWIMHEYRLEREGSALVARRLPAHKFSGKDEWVVCRIFKKQSGSKKNLCQVDSILDPYHSGYLDPSSPLHDHADMDDDRETSLSPYGTNRVTSFKELVSPSALNSGNPLSILGEMNGRCVFPSYSSSSFPGNNTTSLSPTTGPMSSDLSSTLQSPAYAELPSQHHLNNILNVVSSSAPNYNFAGNYSMMAPMLNQPMLQGGHMGGLRSCKVEYMGTLGEDEAHSGQTTSSGALLDSISPNSHGWIPTVANDLQFGAGQHPVTMQPRHAQITQDQLNQVSNFFPAPESSCVTEENANSLYRQQMNNSLASRFLQGDNSTSGLVPGWA